MSIKLYFLLQCWQVVVTIKLLYMYHPFIISSLSTAILQNLPAKLLWEFTTYTYSRDHQHENSSTVVRTIGTGGQHCHVTERSSGEQILMPSCLPLHEGSFKACGGSYHNRAFHVSMSAGVSISAVIITVGKRTVYLRATPRRKIGTEGLGMR